VNSFPQAVRRHLVRLQRDAPDMQRLGFGNVVAGPPHAPATRQDDGSNNAMFTTHFWEW
jgi:hypothetical protein